MNLTNFAQYYEQHMMDNQNWGWGMLMIIFFLIFIGTVIILIIKSSHTHSHTQHKDIEPIEVAKSRYAKGEITKQEFDEIKKTIK